MISTKAKIIIFTTIGVVASLGVATAALFIRDNENKSYLTAIERDTSEFCGDTVYGTSAYTFSINKSLFKAEDSAITMNGYFSNSSFFADCDYALFYVENSNFSDLLKCNFSCKETNFFEKISKGLDAIKVDFSLSKAFNGQTFFTPVAFVDEDTSMGYLVKNNVYSSCIIESYLSADNFSIDKTEIVLRNGSAFQGADFSILNKSHKQIKTVTIEKDKAEVDFNVAEIKYEDEKSYFRILFQENEPGYHFVRLSKATFMNEYNEEIENKVISNYQKYNAINGVALLSSSFSEIVNDDKLEGTLIFENPNNVVVNKVILEINGTDTEVPINFYKKESEETYYVLSTPLDENIENGTFFNVKVKKIYYSDDWDFVSDTEKTVKKEKVVFSNFRITSSSTSVTAFEITLETPITNLETASCKIIYGAKTATASLDVNSNKKILSGTIVIGKESGFYISLSEVTLKISSSVKAYPVDLTAYY